jgi:hypothetical protein
LKTGEDTNGVTIVTAGLTLNELVVTSNQYRLQGGTRVRTISAAASTAAPKAT